MPSATISTEGSRLPGTLEGLPSPRITSVVLLRLFGPSGGGIANGACLKSTEVSFLPFSCEAQEAGGPGRTAEVRGTVLAAPCRGHVLVLPSPLGSEEPGKAGHVLTARVSAAGEG